MQNRDMQSIFGDILDDTTDISPKMTSGSFSENDYFIQQIKDEAKNEAKIEFSNVYMKNELFYQEKFRAFACQLHIEREKNKKLTDSCYLISRLAKEYKDKYEILLKETTSK